MHGALRTHRVRYATHARAIRQTKQFRCMPERPVAPRHDLAMNIGERDISQKRYTTSFMSSQDSRIITCSPPVGVCVCVDVCMSQWGKPCLPSAYQLNKPRQSNTYN